MQIKTPSQSCINDLGRSVDKVMFAVAILFCSTFTQAQTSSSMSRAEAEQKLDGLSQKIELIERTNAIRFDALDKVRAAELKLLDDKFEAKLKLLDDKLDIKKDVIATAQKSIDWWFAGLAFLMVIFSVAVPVLFTWTLRTKHAERMKQIDVAYEAIQADRTYIQAGRIDIQAGRIDIQHAKQLADDALEVIQSQKDKANVHLADLEQRIKQMRNEPLDLKNEAATALARQIAESSTPALADRLFAKGVISAAQQDWKAAATWFAGSTLESPTGHAAIFNWGVALGKLAMTTDVKADRGRLLREAINKYMEALALKPTYDSAAYNLGEAWGQIADLSPIDEQPDLLKLSIAAYDKALEINPKKVQALVNLGVALGRLAHHRSNAADDSIQLNLRNQATERFQAALELAPGDPPALSSFGAHLVRIARHSSAPVDRDRTLSYAIEILTRLRAIEGHPSFNLACLSAIRGDAAGFVALVEQIPPDKLPDCGVLQDDPDLNGIRASVEFSAWFEKRCSGHN